MLTAVAATVADAACCCCRCSHAVMPLVPPRIRYVPCNSSHFFSFFLFFSFFFLFVPCSISRANKKRGEGALAIDLTQTLMQQPLHADTIVSGDTAMPDLSADTQLFSSMVKMQLNTHHPSILAIFLLWVYVAIIESQSSLVVLEYLKLTAILSSTKFSIQFIINMFSETQSK